MLRCIIVDDEDIAIEILKNYLEKVPGICIEQVFTNAVQAFDYLQQKKIDLIFLDINMPLLNGLSFLETLKEHPAVILTTAHSEFALESYKYMVVDYLLKPFSFEQFLKALGKLALFKRISLDLPEITAESNLASTEPSFIFIKSERQFIKIKLADILYIESERNYIKIKTDTKSYLTQMTITEIESKLPPQHFIRIHRSYIVEINKIEKFNSLEVEVAKQILPIGTGYKNTVLSRLLKHSV